MKKFILSLGLVALVSSCAKDNTSLPGPSQTSMGTPELPAILYNYASPDLPPYLINGPVANADNTPPNNPVTNEGATLGRVLFYDKNLSLNGTVSCGSCHRQDRGFSDPRTLSEGFEGGATGRHSMGLANSRFYANGRFFWDERASSLEEQVLLPIQDEVEMGMSLDSLVQRLNALEYYPELFRAAYGDALISQERIARSLAQFVRSMISFQSPYDQGRVQVQNPAQDFPNYTPLENQGKQLFLSPQLGCAAFHGTDAFIAPGARNNGLDATITDPGAGVNGMSQLNGKFKVGSLKNIASTAPYMHDGRFTTLREVIEHYNSGVQFNPALDPPLRQPNGTARQLNLTETEKLALIAFLQTLSDTDLSLDPKFSDPFPES